jgi:hypothetical protein
MTVSTSAYLKGFHDTTKALGSKVINSDFTLEIEGFEAYYLLAKQCPWPENSSAGEIEVENQSPGPGYLYGNRGRQH